MNELPGGGGRQGAPSQHEALFLGERTVRSGRWKLKGDELFDLSTDIRGIKNVARAHGDVVRQLNLLLKIHQRDLSRAAGPCGVVASSG